MEDDTYVEQIEGVFQSGVACRNTGENFVAPEKAFKERAFADLVEEAVDLFERPVWSDKSEGIMTYMTLHGTHSTSFAIGARSSSATVKPASTISLRIEIKTSAQRSARRRDA